MGENIMLVVVLLLALYGCAELIRRLVIQVMKPEPDCSGMLVIPVSGHRTDIEYIIRSAVTQSRWAEFRREQRVLLFDAGMDEETRQLAEKVCSETGAAGIYRAAELGSLFDGDLPKTDS
ncbi:MAG: hypothetical protein HFJ80_01830 [Clostridiales bacterium]|nr:hypothetical protein [Clostridiales bacterium]